MINRVILVGRLTKEPEIRMTPSGAKVCQYTLAVNRNRKADGQPEADFISCVSWNKTAELMNQYLSKGALIGIEGRIQTRSYDDNTGRKVYVTEIITDSVQFLESKTKATQNQNNMANGAYYQQQSTQSQSYGFESDDTLDIASDDLPF